MLILPDLVGKQGYSSSVFPISCTPSCWWPALGGPACCTTREQGLCGLRETCRCVLGSSKGDRALAGLLMGHVHQENNSTVTKTQANAPPCYSQLPCEGSALGAYHSDFHSVLGYQQNQVNPEWFCFEYEHRKTIALIQLSSVNLPCEIQGNLQEALGFPTMRDGSAFICMVTPPTYALCKIP